MKAKISKIILIFICLFVSVGAFYGSICMFIDPTGKLLHMENMLPYFKVLPLSDILFTNYIFSGISLLIVNGLINLLAVILLLKNKKNGITLGTIFGFTLMLWITIQFIIFPKNALSISFFIIGALQMLTGYIAYIYDTQNEFIFNKDDYPNIGKDKKILVVYYSRKGYTKKVAYEEANKLKADILELQTTEKTEGDLGFWWCGRFNMHKWRMPLKKINKDISAYQKIIIVSPIWVFTICAPIREFCYKYQNDINEVEYIFTHFMNAKFKNVADEVDNILNKKRKKYTSIIIRLGKVKNKKNN